MDTAGLARTMAAALALGACCLAPAEKYAVLVGVSEYQSESINPLPGDVADVKGVAAALEDKAGFSAENVRVLTSDATDAHLLATRSNINFELGNLQAKVHEGDVVFVLFSGHGWYDLVGTKKSFFLPVDADSRNDMSLIGSCVSDDDIRSSLEKLPARAVIVAFDMCRTDFHKKKGQDPDSLGAAQEKRLVLQAKSETGTGPDAVVELFSCSPNESSYLWQQRGRSYFSYFLEQGLRSDAADAKGDVTVSSLVSYLESAVSGAVQREEGQPQHPYPDIHGAGALDFVIASGGEPNRDAGKVSDLHLVNASDQAYATAFQRASDLFNARKYDEAGKAFKEAATAKETPFAVNYEGLCADDLGHSDEAEKLYRRAMELDPKLPFATCNLGWLLWRVKRDGVEAEKLLRRAMELDPWGEMPPLDLAIVLLARGSLDEAEKMYRKAIELEPKDSRPINGLGNVLYGRLNYTEAEKLYRQAMSMDPTAAAPVCSLGEIMCARGDYDDGEKLFRQSMELDPKSARQVSDLGNIMYARHNYDEAEKLYRQAIALDTTDVPGFTGLGDVMVVKGNFVEAEKAYRQALDINPRDSYAANGLGNVMFAVQNYAESEKFYRLAIDINPSGAMLHANLAGALLRLGKRDEAMAEASRAITLGLKDSPVYKELGLSP